jgi:hypothetical protein
MPVGITFPYRYFILTPSQGLNIDVKNRILRHVQNWAIALEGKPQFLYINTVYKTLQKEGLVVPSSTPVPAADTLPCPSRCRLRVPAKRPCTSNRCNDRHSDSTRMDRLGRLPPLP